MKKLIQLLVVLLAAVSLTLAGCGGGGGGGNDGNPPPVAGLVFNMVELAGLGGGFSAGVAINEGGLAVGLADDGTSIKGVKWTVTDALPAGTQLNPLPGNNYSAAYGVNDLGVAVGESGATVATVADANTVAVYWPAGSTTPTALSTTGLFAGGASAAFSINSAGKIVGEAVADADGNTVAVYWASPSAAPVTLGNLASGSFSSAYFISNTDDIVGEAQHAGSQPRAVFWMPAVAGGYQAPAAMSTVANQVGSVAFGIDFSGRIVGEAELTDGTVQGMIWNASGALVTSLGTNTSAQAINDQDLVVGFNAALSGNDRAVIWNAANVLDFKVLTNVFSQAYALNDSREVVGHAAGQAFAALPVD